MYFKTLEKFTAFLREVFW